MTSVNSEQVFIDSTLKKFCSVFASLSGNVETLKERPIKDGIDVRQALLEFHNKWYSANIMSLVVLGKGSLINDRFNRF